MPFLDPTKNGKLTDFDQMKYPTEIIHLLMALSESEIGSEPDKQSVVLECLKGFLA